MPKDILPDLAIVLTFLRSGLGWSQAELGEAANVSPSLLNDYEHGRKPLKRDRLDYLVSFMGHRPKEIDGTLERLQANRAAVKVPGGAGELSPIRQRIEAVAAKAGRLATEFVRAVLSLLAWEAEALQAREAARRQWARLERRTAEERTALVEESKKFRGWALSELVAAKSIEKAPSSPAEALELAMLALRIAELSPGEKWLRERAQGNAWFHVANARRVINDLRGSDVALATATRHWEAGASGDPGLFSEAIVLGLEATIRKAQRRFPEALRRIEEALAADQGGLRAQLLLAKAQILGAVGDIEASTEVLREAIPYIAEDREPRTALGVRFQLMICLCLQDRAAEAAHELPNLHVLAEKLDQDMDRVRLVWLEGKVAAGTGRVEEAEEAFEQARRKFVSYKPPLVFNYALVSLDLGLLLLGQGRNIEVATLAEEMVSIFSSQGVHREALAALQMFCEAAKRGAATVELTRGVIRFLHRSQEDPELRFEGGEGDGGCWRARP